MLNLWKEVLHTRKRRQPNRKMPKGNELKIIHGEKAQMAKHCKM